MSTKPQPHVYLEPTQALGRAFVMRDARKRRPVFGFRRPILDWSETGATGSGYAGLATKHRFVFGFC